MGRGGIGAGRGGETRNVGGEITVFYTKYNLVDSAANCTCRKGRTHQFATGRWGIGDLW